MAYRKISFTNNEYYHVYNRGIDKRVIFETPVDFQRFADCLQFFNSFEKVEIREREKRRSSSPEDSPPGERKLVDVICYCLMPNHFHLLVKQRNSGSIDKFMNSICTRYTMYFNKKYKRIGRLYQDVYKAVLVENEMQLLYLTAYIHRNPTIGKRLRTKGDPFRAWFSQPSSYPEYLGQKQTKWVSTDEILSFFSKNNPQLSYQNFVEQTNDITPIADLFLDS